MPRRLVKQIFWCGNAGKYAVFELSAVTARLKAERAAVEVSAIFFNALGKRLPVSHGPDGHRFFADPLGEVSTQRAYFEKPAGACWCHIAIQRLTPTQRIGLVGKPRAVHHAGFSLLPLADALAGRDRQQLLAHLAVAKEKVDRKTAGRVLERMIFLEKRQEDKRLLRLVSDIDAVLAAGAKPQPAEPGAAIFVYDRCLTSSYSETIPISKWLASEAVDIQRRAEGRAISVAPGPDAALRFLAAGNSGSLVDASFDSFDEVSPYDWISDDDFNAILSSNSARADL